MSECREAVTVTVSGGWFCIFLPAFFVLVALCGRWFVWWYNPIVSQIVDGVNY